MGYYQKTRKPGLTPSTALLDSALLPEWGNARAFEVEMGSIGTTLNIGTAAEMFPSQMPGPMLPGGGSQVLLPQGWSTDWINGFRALGPQ